MTLIDDAQEEMDVVSALNNHFMYMVEAFKDIIENVSKSDQRIAFLMGKNIWRYAGVYISFAKNTS